MWCSQLLILPAFLYNSSNYCISSYVTWSDQYYFTGRLVFLLEIGWDLGPPQLQSNIWTFLHKTVPLFDPDLTVVTHCNIPSVQQLGHGVYKTTRKCKVHPFCPNKNVLVVMTGIRSFTSYFFDHLIARNNFQHVLHLQWCFQMPCGVLSQKSCDFPWCWRSAKLCLSLPGLIKQSGGESSASSGGSVQSSDGQSTALGLVPS